MAGERVHLEDVERAMRLASGLAGAAAIGAGSGLLIAGLGLALGLAAAAIALPIGLATGAFGIAALWRPLVAARVRGHARGRGTSAPAELRQAP